jgi:adenosine deaminase
VADDGLNREILKDFPKVELHRHLEGSFPADRLYELALKNNLPLPKDFEAFKKEVQFPADSSPDFLTFLTKFKNDWYSSLEDVEFITYHSVRELVRDGIFFIELRFSPEHFCLKNDFDRVEVTRLIIAAGNRAAQEMGLHIRYLLTFNRSKQSCEEMIALYNRLKRLGNNQIVGIDLAGDEINYPPELFEDFFSLVNADGLYRTTIHAGEVTESGQIWKAIQTLGAARIGHGTSTVRDPGLQAYLKERGIALEQCITSNYQTGSWPDEKSHPLGVLYRRGVPVTMNSDDPSIQNTDLTDDYLKAVRYFDFTLEDLVALNRAALKASFVSEETRQYLSAEYERALEKFRGRRQP